MIYEYETYFVVQFSNKTRARYSKNKYGSLINKVVSQSVSLDKKVYNYYEVVDSVVKLYYWNQKENKEVCFLIDKEDFEKISDRYWSQNCNGYIFSRKGNIRVFLHRYIMNLTDQNLVVDHINHDILDNRKSNLRIATFTQNNLNRRKMVGVHQLKNGLYEARIAFYGQERRKKNISKEEAIELRKKWEKEMFNDQL